MDSGYWKFIALEVGWAIVGAVCFIASMAIIVAACWLCYTLQQVTQ